MSSDSMVQSSGVRVFPPLLYAAGIGAGYLLHWWWPLGLMTAGNGLVLVVRVVGWVFIAASITLPIWA